MVEAMRMLSFRAPESMISKLEQIAEERGVERSEVAREVMQKALDLEEAKEVAEAVLDADEEDLEDEPEDEASAGAALDPIGRGARSWLETKQWEAQAVGRLIDSEAGVGVRVPLLHIPFVQVNARDVTYPRLGGYFLVREVASDTYELVGNKEGYISAIEATQAQVGLQGVVHVVPQKILPHYRLVDAVRPIEDHPLDRWQRYSRDQRPYLVKLKGGEETELITDMLPVSEFHLWGLRFESVAGDGGSGRLLVRNVCPLGIANLLPVEGAVELSSFVMNDTVLMKGDGSFVSAAPNVTTRLRRTVYVADPNHVVAKVSLDGPPDAWAVFRLFATALPVDAVPFKVEPPPSGYPRRMPYSGARG